MNELVVNAGGRLCTRAELAALPVPEGTLTHTIVPHARLVDDVMEQLRTFQLAPWREKYAVSDHRGLLAARFFGVIDLKVADMPKGMGISIGIRNSHDKSMMMGLAGGARVFVCDNLAFSGELVRFRKHSSKATVHDVTKNLVGDVVGAGRTEAKWIDSMKAITVADSDAKALIVDALRNRAITMIQVPKVVSLYFDAPQPDDPIWYEALYKRERTAYALYGAFTEILKGRLTGSLINRCRDLNAVFAQVCPRPAFVPVEGIKEV